MLSNKLRVKLAFVLLFGLVPYKILGICGINIFWKIIIGIISIILFYFLMEEVTPFLLNSLLIQLFFFSCLRIEEYLCTANLFYSLLFVSVIPLELTIIAGNSNDPDFWYFLMVFLFNLYYRLKEIFLSPKFQGSVYVNLEQTIGHNEDKFTWDFIVLNMSAISKGLFRSPVENQLGFPKSRQTFPYIAKRYVFTRIFTSIKGNPEIVGAVGVTSSIVGFIYSEHKNSQRHREITQLGQESNKGQERLAKSQEMLSKSQEMVAKEMSKANLLEELRLKDSLKEVKAPSVLADDQIKFCSLSKFFFLICE